MRGGGETPPRTAGPQVIAAKGDRGDYFYLFHYQTRVE